MVGQVVAGAVAPVVVQSATSEDGLINKLFKIALLIGVLGVIAVVIGIALFITDTNLRESIASVVVAPIALAGGLLPFGIGQPFRVLGLGLSGLTSAFAFRRS